MSNQKRDDIMSDTIRETSPKITPDSLRKINQVNKALYDSYTKRNFGRTDVFGSQYSGTVENFGFEMLLEARKLKMEKPSLEGVFEINNYKYYFDLQYSNMIETYAQQGMIEAVLRKDVFLPNKEYRIKFSNCKNVLVPRSEGWGQLHVDPTNPTNTSKVFKDKFIYTNTAPKLLIRDLSSGITSEIDLRLEAVSDSNVDYYFYNGFSTQKFIESYSGGELVTVPLTDTEAGLPFVWICEDIFISLPPINLTGNEPITNKPILSIGTDGQNDSHIYPIIYGVGSLPTQPDQGEWFLKAYSKLDGFMPGGSTNHSSKLSQIFYTFRPNGGNDIDYEITFEEEYIKISLSDKVEWNFVRNQINDPYHAEISLNGFISNGSDDDRTVLIPAFDIGFSDNYLFYPYEGLCEEAQSGIHVDILSDYSENSTPKKNGIIHSLGEFDGLPSYFKTFHGRVLHRSHVELYALRERLNRYTQTPMKKQTAALILDSAMPQKELQDLALDQEPAIIYQYNPDEYLYVTDPEKVVSKKNVVSEITFNDENTFGNSNIPAHRKKKRFIYHGNRTFSLGAIEYDPELETARVYYINNDSIKYVNNVTVDDEHKRAPRTLARICDIPTTYEQLMHIDNVAATYLFDRKYVRMGASFDIEDLDVLMNDRGLKIVQVPNNSGVNQWLYGYRDDLPTKQQLIDAGYCRTVNIRNSYIPITATNFNILAGGNGYDVDDTFYVLVGGKAYDGKVVRTTLAGNVQEVEITVDDDAMVSVYNVEGRHTPLKTVTVTSEMGDNLQIELEISEGDINSHTPKNMYEYAPDYLVTFKSDVFGNIFLYELQLDWTWKKICQVEGDEYIENWYDIHATVTPINRSFNDAFYKMIFAPSYRASDDIFFDPMSYIRESVKEDYEGARGHKGDDETADLSKYITGRNMPNTYYTLEMTDGADNGHFDLKTYEMLPVDNYSVTLPRFHRNNTVSYYNPTNRFLISESSLNGAQPTLFVYSPSHNKRIDSSAGENRRDTVIITSSHSTNYNDYGGDLMESSGVLKLNVYYYPEYEFPKEYDEKRTELSELNRNGLITYIRENFGSNAEPFLYEDTDYKYSYNELLDYIMDRYPIDAPEYIKSDLKVSGYAGDHTVNPLTGETIGRSITGGMIPLTSEMFESNVVADGVGVGSLPINIFIIDDVSFDGFDPSFRVHDDDGNDLSNTSVIIWRGNKYIFRDNNWITLAKAVMDGYYNPADKLFYYDQQYTQAITGDIDITYRDITTGQYYKWNGVSYVLISI